MIVPTDSLEEKILSRSWSRHNNVRPPQTEISSRYYVFISEVLLTSHVDRQLYAAQVIFWSNNDCCVLFYLESVNSIWLCLFSFQKPFRYENTKFNEERSDTNVFQPVCKSDEQKQNGEGHSKRIGSSKGYVADDKQQMLGVNLVLNDLLWWVSWKTCKKIHQNIQTAPKSLCLVKTMSLNVYFGIFHYPKGYQPCRSIAP